MEIKDFLLPLKETLHLQVLRGFSYLSTLFISHMILNLRIFKLIKKTRIKSHYMRFFICQEIS
jgi:hypothetical protein